MTETAIQRFLQLLNTNAPRWHRLVLAKPEGAEPGLHRVVVRPLLLRGVPSLSFVYSHATRDVTKNLALDDGLQYIATLVGPAFHRAHLFTANEETQLTISKKGKSHLSVRRLSERHASAATSHAPATVTATVTTTHDREKQRWLTLDRPFLQALGVTTAQQQLVPAMARKWRQINKFIEVFAHALQSSTLAQNKALRVVDFGAGKAYLSFALHDWLRHSQHIDAEVTGIELREELVQQGEHIIRTLGLQGMHMHQGDVRTSSPPRMDVMIALHACDTATDHAIHLGLRAGASIIMCSPCCHKELRPQLLSPHPLRSVFQHGIHAEQQAEMVTDSLRALLLESQGYDTQVFEFVALEHTRKNKMILAVKREVHSEVLRSADAAQAVTQAALAKVNELKTYFGVQQQTLENLLHGNALEVQSPLPSSPTNAGEART